MRVIFVVLVSFSSGATSLRDTRGRSRPDIAHGLYSTFVEPAQGTGSRCQLTGGPFPELVC